VEGHGGLDLRPLYIADTSALGDLVTDYAAAMTAPVWDFVGALADSGRLQAPRAVFKELMDSGITRVVEWAKAHDTMFIEHDDPALIAAALEVAKQYEGRFVPTRKRRSPGDVWVVALALVRIRADESKLFRRDVFVVQHESPRRNAKESKPKIPDVCRDLGIKCIRLPEMLVLEEQAAEQ
jgi:hypothetical protein